MFWWQPYAVMGYVAFLLGLAAFLAIGETRHQLRRRGITTKWGRRAQRLAWRLCNPRDLGGRVRVFAYCTERAREAVRAAVGVEPITSPPEIARGLNTAAWSEHDLIYVRLHGHPQLRDVWFGAAEGGFHPLALTSANIRAMWLDNAVVVVANCYSAESGIGAELYKAGAGTVIAGRGSNYAAGDRVIGADLLVQWIIRLMDAGWPVRRALHGARLRLLATAWRRADRDALMFTIV